MRWRRLVPPRRGFLRLAASPSSYLLVLAFALTFVAKLAVARALVGVGAWPLWLVVVTGSDLALAMTLAALFSIGEGRTRWLLLATLPIAGLVLLLSLLNAAYLGMTGEQLDWQTLALGLDRLGEVLGIVGEQLGHLSVLAWIVAAVVIVGVPLGALWLLRRGGHPLHPMAESRPRGHAALALALVGVACHVVSPRPPGVALRRLDRSAVLATYWGWLSGTAEAGQKFDGYHPHDLVAPSEIQRFAAGHRPNVVVLVMESTRFDATTLAGPAAPAHTPNLEALAARGTWVRTARAAVPHTTKSVWSMLCGRLPLMQLALTETSLALDAQCLPSVLGAAGYDTALLQSSLGSFEDRPRLAANLGFRRFAAWEDTGGTPLGYLASDDASLAAPFARLVADARAAHAPFFAVVLTSSTHHPYRLPPELAAAVAARGAPAGTPRERYDRLVEGEDALLGELLAIVARAGVGDDTIVVALGDHGEGFGDQGVRQHDTNFFEEGLRVPWVMAGPGVPHTVVAGDASLVDLTPTLLHALGIARTAEAAAASTAVDLLAGAPTEPRVFGCWFDRKCRGLVRGPLKLVEIPEQDERFAFDLDRDPGEATPRELTASERALLDRADRLIEAHQSDDFPLVRGELLAYPPWRCPAGGRCLHPRSPPKGFFGE